MILVIGASGILGQHMRLCQPPDESVVYTSRGRQLPHDYGLKLETPRDIETHLERWWPSVVINLSGENRPDVVERDLDAYQFINAQAPIVMASWCRANGKCLIHVSTQGVLGGRQAPYAPGDPDPMDPPVNKYGAQKLVAELGVILHYGTVARVTFLLGIRPFPHIGRANPLEQMLEAATGKRQQQVSDRFFSPCWAEDAALALWKLAVQPATPREYVHIGIPLATTRAAIATQVVGSVGGDIGLVESVRHDEAFPAPAWAPRPLNTAYKPALDDQGEWVWTKGMIRALHTWRHRLDYMDAADRAIEIGTFLGISQAAAAERLNQGFGFNHGKVAEDFRRVNPETDAALLEWYRGTDAYIWELTAYHLDAGFNYMGMCEGIINHLKAHGKTRVLCVGDGVGDLSMKCKDAGLEPIYHDLVGSKTALFAQFRMDRRYGLTGGPWAALSPYWEAPDDGPSEYPEFVLTGTLDAVVALDFFEHMVDVEGWVRRAWAMLKPGGLFLGHNAFHIGNEPGGSLPMHLVRNDRYEKDWDPLMDGIGYVRTGEGNWRIKPNE